MDQQILERFFKGECSEEEQRRIIHWYRSGEADQELAAKIEIYWKELTKKKADLWGREDLFASISKQLPPSDDKIRPLKANIMRDNRGWNYAAAIALIILSLGWGYYLFFYTHTLNSNPTAESLIPKEHIVIKKTAKGEKLTLILEDSTVVKLNSGSQLKYNSASAREVELQGEAFFEVKRDTIRPFQIHTGSITTTVLGTSFNIKAIDTDEEVEVSVISGKVKVARQEAWLEAGQETQQNKKEEALYLIPGEQAIYKHMDTVFTKKTYDEQEVLSWKEGRLNFKNAAFSDVINMLEHWYGVEIEVQRKEVEDGFSGSYTNRSLESVLEGMSFVLNFEYEIRDKTIIIK